MLVLIVYCSDDDGDDKTVSGELSSNFLVLWLLLSRDARSLHVTGDGKFQLRYWRPGGRSRGSRRKT